METCSRIEVLGHLFRCALSDNCTTIVSRTAGVKKVVSHVIMANDPRRIMPRVPKPNLPNNYDAPSGYNNSPAPTNYDSINSSDLIDLPDNS